MKVIARNNGPKSQGKHDGSLKEGKEYNVIEWAYQDHPGHWVIKNTDFINPTNPKFFIKVINEFGDEADYWNDYFLSATEIREYKLEKLGI